jgi:hypothetical protein
MLDLRRSDATARFLFCQQPAPFFELKKIDTELCIFDSRSYQSTFFLEAGEKYIAVKRLVPVILHQIGSGYIQAAFSRSSFVEDDATFAFKRLWSQHENSF